MSSPKSVNDVLMGYKLSLDMLSALGFIVDHEDRAIALFGADFYASCVSIFRNVHID